MLIPTSIQEFIAGSRLASLRMRRRRAYQPAHRTRSRPRIEEMEDRCLLSPTITEFRTPTASSYPRRITAGPDGNLWFTEYNANKIGMINPATHATAEFTVPTTGLGLGGIVAGPDGNLWFAEGDVKKRDRDDQPGDPRHRRVPRPNRQCRSLHPSRWAPTATSGSRSTWQARSG